MPTSTSPWRARCSAVSGPPASAARRSARDRPSRRPRRLHGAVHEGRTDAPIGDPTEDVLYGPTISARFSERYERWLELIRPHHTTSGSDGLGRITADNPRTGFVGDPESGLYYHPAIVDGVTIEDDLYRTETFGPIVGVASFDTFDQAMDLANEHGYGLSSSIYTNDPLHVFRFRDRHLRGDGEREQLTSGAEAHLPFGGNGRSGEREPAIRPVGARSVHPVAGDELGLLGASPEGADGHRRAGRRPGVPAADPLRRRGRGRRAAGLAREELGRLLDERLRLLLFRLVRGEVPARSAASAAAKCWTASASSSSTCSSTVPPPPPGGSGSPPETAPVASSIASGRLSATDTLVPFTTMTSFSSGTAASCLARTYIGRTYRIESSTGIVRRSPNWTSEPPARAASERPRTPGRS